MADVIVKRVADMDYYKGANAIAGIKFRGARAALGVSAWGMGVLEMEPNLTGYPEHDDVKDGQEEVGPQGCVVLALGATPGKAYEPRR